MNYYKIPGILSVHFVRAETPVKALLKIGKDYARGTDWDPVYTLRHDGMDTVPILRSSEQEYSRAKTLAKSLKGRDAQMEGLYTTRSIISLPHQYSRDFFTPSQYKYINSFQSVDENTGNQVFHAGGSKFAAEAFLLDPEDRETELEIDPDVALRLVQREYEKGGIPVNMDPESGRITFGPDEDDS